MAIKFEEKTGKEPGGEKPAGKAKPAPPPAAAEEADAGVSALPFAKPVRPEKGRKGKR